MKKMIGSIMILTLLSSISWAKSKKPKDSKNLNNYVQQVSKLTGKKYLVSGDLKGSIRLSKNLKLNSDNADIIFSHILHENGYTRIPIEGENAYRIINARDVRYTPVPHYYATKEKLPTLPNTADYHMMTYTFSEAEYGTTTEVTRSLRPFMSRYGRIIDIKSQRKIVLQDTALNIKRLYKIIKDLDVKPSKELREEREKNRSHQQQLQLLEAKHCGKKEK